jgi:hypothetical protein
VVYFKNGSKYRKKNGGNGEEDGSDLDFGGEDSEVYNVDRANYFGRNCITNYWPPVCHTSFLKKFGCDYELGNLTYNLTYIFFLHPLFVTF